MGTKVFAVFSRSAKNVPVKIKYPPKIFSSKFTPLAKLHMNLSCRILACWCYLNKRNFLKITQIDTQREKPDFYNRKNSSHKIQKNCRSGKSAMKRRILTGFLGGSSFANAVCRWTARSHELTPERTPPAAILLDLLIYWFINKFAKWHKAELPKPFSWNSNISPTFKRIKIYRNIDK